MMFKTEKCLYLRCRIKGRETPTQFRGKAARALPRATMGRPAEGPRDISTAREGGITKNLFKMAKSKAFFGLRSGSTKSHTYQVFRGEQITKDRVTKVANPQTDAQMLQRIKLAQVANAAAALKTLVNHSMQGIAYGYPSVAEFRRMNLKADTGVNWVSWVPKGYSDPGMANYKVSKGSIVPKTYQFSDGHLFFKAGNGSFDGGDGAGKEATAQSVADTLGINVGDQLTILLQVTSAKWVTKYNGKDSFYPTRFLISRIVTDESDDGYNIITSADGNPWTNKSANSNAPDELHNLFLSLTSNQDVDDPTITVTFKDTLIPSLGGISAKNLMVVAGAVIISRKVDGVYQRSENYLATNGEAGNTHVGYSTAAPTYLKSTSTSSLYLNSGDTSTSIGTI